MGLYGMFVIRWKPKAKHQIQKINDAKLRCALFDKIDELQKFPHCANIKMLKNHSADYRLRVGNYRVLFSISTMIKIIDILEVKKRDDQTY
jgi:mRNA interferase RelE/StbE